MSFHDRTPIRIDWIDGRHADPADVDAIDRLQQEVFGDQYGQDDVTDQEMVEDTDALLARRGDDLVGVALLVRPGAPRYWFERFVSLDDPILPPDLTRANVVEGDGIIVAPALRGRRLGSMLFMLLAFVSLEHGARYVMALQSPMSKGITERMGHTYPGLRVKVGVHHEELVLGNVEALCRASLDPLRSRLALGDVVLEDALARLLPRPTATSRLTRGQPPTRSARG